MKEWLILLIGQVKTATTKDSTKLSNLLVNFLTVILTLKFSKKNVGNFSKTVSACNMKLRIFKTKDILAYEIIKLPKFGLKNVAQVKDMFGQFQQLGAYYRNHENLVKFLSADKKYKNYTMTFPDCTLSAKAIKELFELQPVAVKKAKAKKTVKKVASKKTAKKIVAKKKVTTRKKAKK